MNDPQLEHLLNDPDGLGALSNELLSARYRLASIGEQQRLAGLLAQAETLAHSQADLFEVECLKQIFTTACRQSSRIETNRISADAHRDNHTFVDDIER